MKARKCRNHVSVHPEFDTLPVKGSCCGWLAPHRDPKLALSEVSSEDPSLLLLLLSCTLSQCLCILDVISFFQFSSSRSDVPERGAASAAARRWKVSANRSAFPSTSSLSPAAPSSTTINHNQWSRTATTYSLCIWCQTASRSLGTRVGFGWAAQSPLPLLLKTNLSSVEKATHLTG